MSTYFKYSFLSFLFLFLLTSCKNWEEYREERFQKAVEHFDLISKRTLPADKILTLHDCIGIAIQNNLDLEVNRLREKIAQERLTAELLGMLPDMLITDDWHMRSNRPASSSQSITTGGATYNYSQSSAKYENTLKVEMALSVLDFGLAYLNSSQAQDKGMMESEQLRRTEQNLTLEVVKTYFKVASTQDAISQTEALLKKCADIQETIRELASEKEVSLLRLFDEQKRIIRIQRTLMDFRRNYEDGCIELRSLMGIMPSSEIHLDTSLLRNVPEVEIPDVDQLEKAALVERAELYNLDIQKHVTLTESRKAILMMMPNVRLFMDFNNSSNPFLYHSSWMELGIRAAYNLLKLPQEIAKYRSLRAEIDENEMRTLALTVGVMAQVRISHANLMEQRKRYELDEKVYAAYKNYEDYSNEAYQAGTAFSQLEMDRLAMETVEMQIQKTLSLGEYYVAYYRLRNAVGLDNIQKDFVGNLVKKIENEEIKQKNLEKND